MIVGYLGNDRKIYDRHGRFIKEYGLEEGETEVKRLEIDCSVCSFWSTIGRLDPQIHMDSGVGTLIQTNKRLIFIRDFKLSREFSNHPFFGSAVVSAMKARELRNLGYREYFEVPLNEIVGYVNERRDYTLLILTKDLEIRAVVVSKTLNSLEIVEILKKEMSRREAKKMEKEIKRRKKEGISGDVRTLT